MPKQPKVRYELSAGGWQDDDVITEWHLANEIVPDSYALQDYRHETAGLDLSVNVEGEKKYELFEFPGKYGTIGDGERLARIRLQEAACRRSVAEGVSDCRAFTAGYTFELTSHYASAQNKTFVLTQIEHEAFQGDDGRARLIYLTEKGRRVRDQLQRIIGAADPIVPRARGTMQAA